MEFYKCKHCGNIIAFVKNKGEKVSCCNEEMIQLKAGSVDASQEKHVPVYHKEGNKIVVSVGSVSHPMSEEHYIEWIALVTNNGNQRKVLSPSDKPEAIFYVDEKDEVKEVYAYCNLHGLWKA